MLIARCHVWSIAVVAARQKLGRQEPLTKHTPTPVAFLRLLSTIPRTTPPKDRPPDHRRKNSIARTALLFTRLHIDRRFTSLCLSSYSSIKTRAVHRTRPAPVASVNPTSRVKLDDPSSVLPAQHHQHHQHHQHALSLSTNPHLSQHLPFGSTLRRALEKPIPTDRSCRTSWLSVSP